MENDRHKRKFLDFILSPISKIDSPQILEFGVSKKGMSTSIFLDLCKKNSGKLLSVDTNNDSRKFQESNWRFINARDDDYDVIAVGVYDLVCDFGRVLLSRRITGGGV